MYHLGPFSPSVVASTKVGEKKPPTSPADSLGVILAGVEVDETKKNSDELMGLIAGGVKVDGKEKPPNKSTGLIGGRFG